MTLREAYKSGRTLVFGHRGASANAPMNTIPAFELAAEHGADGVELDVQLSADGALVIVHDDTVDATTDGTGTVSKMTLAQLQALDAGSWKSEDYRRAVIPTLDAVFEAIGQRLFINVEIKSTTWLKTGIEQKVADCIQRHNLSDRIIVSSFNPLVLRRYRKLDNTMIGLLTAPDVMLFARALALGLPYTAYHPNERTINPAMMQTLTRKQKIVNVWTVNDVARARELRDMGVHSVITDKPGMIRDALAQ